MRRRSYLGAVGTIALAGCLGGRQPRSGETRTTTGQHRPPAWIYTDVVEHVRAVTVAGDSFVVLDADDNVHAIDPATGERRWYVEPPSPHRLAVSGTHVFVVDAESETLVAYRLRDGSRRWRATLDNLERAAYALWAVGGTVYAGGRVRNGYLDPEGHNTLVTGFGETTGMRLWERRYRLERGNWRGAVRPNGEFLLVGKEPVLGASRTNGRADVFGKLVKCSPDGGVVWTRQVEDWLAAELPTAAPDGEWVLAALDDDAENGGLVAYAADGTERWHAYFPGGPEDRYRGVAHRPVVTDEGVLAVLASGRDRDAPGKLCRFDRATGERTATVRLPETVPTGRRPALVDGRLYLPGTDALRAYDHAELSVRETYAVPTDVGLSRLPRAWTLTHPVVGPRSRVVALGVADGLVGYGIP